MQRHMWQSSPGFAGAGYGQRPGFLPPVSLAGAQRGALPLSVAPIGRSGSFGLGSATFSGQPGSQVGYRMGQTEVWKEWYDRARAATQKFEFLLERLETIGNKGAIDEIKVWLGSPSVPDSPAYRYVTVVSDMKEDVERFTPPNYAAYQVERRRNRIAKLEEFNNDLEAMISDAIKTYGERRVIVQTRTTPGQAVAPDLTLPLAIGGGAVALAILLTSL